MKLYNNGLSIAIILCLACSTNYTNDLNHIEKERINQLYEKSLSQLSYPYHNQLKAEKLAGQIQGVPDQLTLSIRYDIAHEYLKAGNNKRVIEIVESYLVDKPINRTHYKYYRLLAMAYLRLGEAENCINHGGHEACILPITHSALHKQSTGAHKAFHLYLRLLDIQPGDTESIWLLNIAAMVTDQYEDLPIKWKLNFGDCTNDFPHFINGAHQYGVADITHAGGTSMEDFNKDGQLDLLTTSYHLDESMIYYEHTDKGFRDVAKQQGVHGLGGGLNFLQGDINNDGFQDILVLRGGWLQQYGQFPVSLLINDTYGGFDDQTAEWGLDISHPVQTGVIRDFDLDGDLDVFVGYESTAAIKRAAALFLNETDTLVESDLANQAIIGWVKGSVSADVDHNGYPDLYISIKGDRNRLLLNQGPDQNSTLIWEEVSESYGVSEPIESFTTMFIDIDNDGWQDLIVSSYDNNVPSIVSQTEYRNLSGDTTRMNQLYVYKNQNGTEFKEVSREYGLTDDLYVMGANYGDVDNNGFLDLYFGTGDFDMWSVMSNRLYMNLDGMKYNDVTWCSRLGTIQKGHGVSMGDLDNDGDLDIYHNIGGAVEGDIFQNALWMNQGNNAAWVTLKLRGLDANYFGHGASVTVYTDQFPKGIHRVCGTGGSFGNNSIQMEIGLGESASIDSVVVSWPWHKPSIDTYVDMAPNGVYELVEHSSKAILLGTPKTSL